MKKEIIPLLTITGILISITLVMASNPFEDIFSSRFESGIAGFIISLIPLVILFVFTFVSYKKGNRTLMSLQFLLWWVFGIYMSMRALAYLDPYLNLGFLPKEFINYFTSENVPTNPEQLSWYVWSVMINATVGLMMMFGNDTFRKIVMRSK